MSVTKLRDDRRVTARNSIENYHLRGIGRALPNCYKRSSINNNYQTRQTDNKIQLQGKRKPVTLPKFNLPDAYED